MGLAYFFEKSSKGVCTTRHWHVSGRLVQKLNVCNEIAHKSMITDENGPIKFAMQNDRVDVQLQKHSSSLLQCFNG